MLSQMDEFPHHSLLKMFLELQVFSLTYVVTICYNFLVVVLARKLSLSLPKLLSLPEQLLYPESYLYKQGR